MTKCSAAGHNSCELLLRRSLTIGPREKGLADGVRGGIVGCGAIFVNENENSVKQVQPHIRHNENATAVQRRISQLSTLLHAGQTALHFVNWKNSSTY